MVEWWPFKLQPLNKSVLLFPVICELYVGCSELSVNETDVGDVFARRRTQKRLTESSCSGRVGLRTGRRADVLPEARAKLNFTASRPSRSLPLSSSRYARLFPFVSPRHFD